MKKIILMIIVIAIISLSACSKENRETVDKNITKVKIQTDQGVSVTNITDGDKSVQVNTESNSEVNNVGNESGDVSQTWQDAYLEILYHLSENLAHQYEPDGTDSRSDYYYDSSDVQIYLGLHDFDDDGTLELIAGDLFTMAVFTYKDGQAEKIADLYFPDIVWCISGVYFKENSISLICSGSGGSDFVNFGYLDGEYVIGLYSELNMDSGITINGIESTLEEVNRIYTLDYENRSEDERKERIHLVRENETWILKYQSGEEVVLDSNFDFNSILW